ncbi:MAG: hypothetical protein ACLTJG_07860 [[Clostridium] innocuum]
MRFQNLTRHPIIFTACSKGGEYSDFNSPAMQLSGMPVSWRFLAGARMIVGGSGQPVS